MVEHFGQKVGEEWGIQIYCGGVWTKLRFMTASNFVFNVYFEFVSLPSTTMFAFYVHTFRWFISSWWKTTEALETRRQTSLVAPNAQSVEKEQLWYFIQITKPGDAIFNKVVHTEKAHLAEFFY